MMECTEATSLDIAHAASLASLTDLETSPLHPVESRRGISMMGCLIARFNAGPWDGIPAVAILMSSIISFHDQE